MMSETVVTIDPNRGGVPPPQPQYNQQPKPATTQQGALSWVKFNYQYFIHTIPGYLKIAQLVRIFFYFYLILINSICSLLLFPFVP